MKRKQLRIVISVIIIAVLIIAVVSMLTTENLFPKNNFPIIERDFDFRRAPSITLQPLNVQQIAKMAEELANPLKAETEVKQIVVSEGGKNSTKLKRFKGYLNNNLPDNWSIINSGPPDFILTGYAFHPKNNAKQTSALFLFLIEWKTGQIVSGTTNCAHSKMTTMCEGLVENLENRQTSGLRVEVINKLQAAQDLFTALTLESITQAKPTGLTLLANDIYKELEEKLSRQQNPPEIAKANATLSITEDSNKLILELSKLPPDYETLGIKTNYTNDKITTACKNLIANLKKKPQMLETIKSLHVAVIHKQPDAQLSTQTALTLEEMVKATPRMRLLGRNYIEAYHTHLRKAIQKGDSSEAPKEGLRQIAVLSIEEDPDGFILELIRLRDHKLLASSVSNLSPFSIHINAKPPARVYMKLPRQNRTDLGFTPQDLSPEQIEVMSGTRFTLRRKDASEINFTYSVDPDTNEWESKSEKQQTYTHRTYKEVELVVKDKGSKREYHYTWW